MSIKDIYKVLPIKSEETYDWLLNKHYAKRIPSISWAFGLYEDGILVGVVCYGTPASPSLVIGVCGEEHLYKVIELNRLVLNDDLPKNSASFLVGASLRMLPKPKIVVSYADTGRGHIGYIYQACNFIYTGLTVARTDIDTGDKHSRHYKKDCDYSKRKIRTQKHRYIYFVGCNKLRAKLNYPILPYPKGDNQRYDASYKPKTQGILFGD